MKTCGVCLQPQPEAAETCSECGEASWLGGAVKTAASPPPTPAHARDTDPPPADDPNKDDAKYRRVGKPR